MKQVMRRWNGLGLYVPVDDGEMTMSVVRPGRVERYSHRDAQGRSQEENGKLRLTHGEPAKTSEEPWNQHLLNLHRAIRAQDDDHIKNWLVWIVPGRAGVHDSVSVG